MRDLRARRYLAAMGVTWLAGAVLLFTWTRAEDAVWPDFSSFYAAAYIARTSPSQIFDLAEQGRVQAEIVGRPAPLLFYHPPYELLPLIPLTLLPYRDAFFAWSALQLGVLLSIPWLMRPLVRAPRSDLHLALVCFAFAPIWIALGQGQDSIILLLLLTLAGRDLMKDRDIRAGLWIGLALFKFQIALPFAALLILSGRRRVLPGWIGGASIAVLASASVAGWQQVARYPWMLATMVREHAYGTVEPAMMLNLRGLLNAVGASRLTPGTSFAIVAIASMLLVLVVLFLRRGPEAGAAGTGSDIMALMAVSVLVSFHFNPHDATVLLLPILFALGGAADVPGAREVVLLIAASLLYSPWTYLMLGGLHLLGLAAPLVLVLALIPGRGGRRV